MSYEILQSYKKRDIVILLITFKMTYRKRKAVELNCKYSLILMFLISI